MMQIGINEGYRLSTETKVTEKGGISIAFTKGEELDGFDYLTADPDTVESEDGSILLFPPNMKDWEGKAKGPRELIKELRKTYKIFYKIFSLYFTKEQLNKAFPINVMYAGLSLNKDNTMEMLKSETVVKKIFENIGDAAAKFIKANKLNEKEPFRIKLLRQSKKKAFPTLTNFPEREDWIELVSIPKKASKVVFTAYEKAQGYDDPTIQTDAVTTENVSVDAAELPDEDSLPEETDELPFN